MMSGSQCLALISNEAANVICLAVLALIGIGALRVLWGMIKRGEGLVNPAQHRVNQMAAEDPLPKGKKSKSCCSVLIVLIILALIAAAALLAYGGKIDFHP